MRNKILLKKGLIGQINKLKKKNKTIVLCHGVFDLYHIGHLKHFQFAKSKGDILIVSITRNKFINKGFNRPFFNETLRCELISSIDCVDYVYLSETSSAIDVIDLVKPNYYCKGIEYKKNKDITKKISVEIKQVLKYGGKIIYSDSITFSSSNLLNENFNLYSEKQKSFLKRIKKKIKVDDINKIFYNISNLKTLVIGETIIDEYVFAEAIGKSGKEPILILREDKKERYMGGAAAIAKNISNFSKKTSLISFVG